MKAIIFESKTGFTKQYAQLLGSATAIPVYSLKDAEKCVPAGSKVIFLGWVMGSHVSGLAKAQKKYDVRAVCAVGMSPTNDETLNAIRKNNQTDGTALFCLRGGVNKEKLGFVQRSMLNMAVNSMRKQADTDPEAKEVVDMADNDKSFVSADNLKEITDWLAEKES